MHKYWKHEFSIYLRYGLAFNQTRENALHHVAIFVYRLRSRRLSTSAATWWINCMWVRFSITLSSIAILCVFAERKFFHQCAFNYFAVFSCRIVVGTVLVMWYCIVEGARGRSILKKKKHPNGSVCRVFWLSVTCVDKGTRWSCIALSLGFNVSIWFLLVRPDQKFSRPISLS